MMYPRIFTMAFLLACGSALAAGRISVVALISDGARFAGQHVVVSGYLAQDQDGAIFLYVDQGSASAGVTPNSVAVLARNNKNFNVDALIGKYVQLDGTFEVETKPTGVAGILVDIGMINDYPLVKALKR